MSINSTYDVVGEVNEINQGQENTQSAFNAEALEYGPCLDPGRGKFEKV